MSNSFEKPPVAPPPESSVEKEKEPILRVLVSRHGPKLSAAGEKNQLAAYFEDHVQAGFKQMEISDDDRGLTRVSSSPVKRAIDTATIHLDKLASTEHRTKDHISRKEELGVPFQPEGEASDKRFSDDLFVIVSMQKELEPGVRESVEHEFSSLSEQEKEAEIRNQFDMAVLTEFFDDANRPNDEKKFQTSADELADGFAKRYAGFSRHTKLLERLRGESKEQPEGEPFVQVDVTHSFPSTAFLKKYLVFEDGTRAQDISPQDFFDRTGGIIRESGSFQMDYVGGDKQAKKINVSGELTPGKKFAGKIDTDALTSLSAHRR